MVALFVLAQAPDPSGPGGKGPGATGSDAAALNLVTTACAACHSLDRVNNKKGDADAWSATVTRMKGMGANLTDQQVPLVAEYLTKAAGTLPVATAEGGVNGGAKGGGKGGGKGGPKNVQVINPATLPETMQSFVEALGTLDQGACAFCHVQDRSSDEKPQKVIARRMIFMVRAINSQFPDGKQHVTCWTCHRGSTMPPATP
jgi:hypothetical protein